MTTSIALHTAEYSTQLLYLTVIDTEAISLALQGDYRPIIFDFYQDLTAMSQSPTAGAAAWEAHAEEHNPAWPENNRQDSIRDTTTDQNTMPRYLAAPLGNVSLRPTQLNNDTHISQSDAGLGLSPAHGSSSISMPTRDTREAPISDSESARNLTTPLTATKNQISLHHRLPPSLMLRGLAIVPVLEEQFFLRSFCSCSC